MDKEQIEVIQVLTEMRERHIERMIKETKRAARTNMYTLLGLTLFLILLAIENYVRHEHIVGYLDFTASGSMLYFAEKARKGSR